MTDSNQIFETLLSGLEFSPNSDQINLLKKLSSFLEPETVDNCFILTGPAGSGKTSLVKSLVNYFDSSDRGYYLASPTGRSAQILSGKTGSYATTIHSLIFNSEFDEDLMQITFSPKYNLAHTDQRFFIIDESSMISDKTNAEGMFVQNTSLLSQLIRFAKQGNSTNKILFIGDKYQLPPVNSFESPALSSDYLTQTHGLKCDQYSLSIVERQCSDSYVLKTANSILKSIHDNTPVNSYEFNRVSSFSAGINRYIADSSNGSLNAAIMIAFANTQVNALNTWVRNFRYQYTNKHVVMPDELMFCNHNVQLDEHLLFKGNHFIVRKIWKPEEFANLHFINAEIEFDNIYSERVVTQTKILLESVTCTDGLLPLELEKQLLHEAFRKNRKFRESKRPSDDAFVNAIRGRYGYALTCHKAQGGEWENVYIHPGFRKENLRWLYTAITRASKELYSWSDNKILV